MGLACLFAHGPGLADGSVRREVRYYEVGGSTAAAIRDELDRSGPRGSDGRRWDGYTRWYLRWRFDLERGASGCRVAEVETTLDVEMTLPRWEAPADADRRLAQRWNDYLLALTGHEEGHAQIAAEAARQVRRRVGQLPAAATCEAATRASNAVAEQVLREANEQERQYDRDTRHGETQGARFP
jgi:predicted secreted Zn-dependent protease